MSKPRLDAIYDVHRTGTGTPQHNDEGCPHSVLTDDVCLNSIAVMDLSHIAQVDDRAVHCLDRQIVELGDHIRTAVQLNQVLTSRDFYRTWMAETGSADRPR